MESSFPEAYHLDLTLEFITTLSLAVSRHQKGVLQFRFTQTWDIVRMKCLDLTAMNVLLVVPLTPLLLPPVCLLLLLPPKTKRQLLAQQWHRLMMPKHHLLMLLR
jgi:hypothetical protein